MSRPFAGYTRVSRVGDRAERLISPELQADRIESYAASTGIEVEMQPPELDVSGGAFVRPILDSILQGIEEGRWAGIIVAQLDRLSRMSILDAHRIIERVEGAGGKVIAVAESFDDATPEGRMGRNVMLSLGEMQLDRYRAQFRAAKARAVREGIWPIPRIPLGYLKDPERRLVPDPKWAPAIVRAFEMRAAGSSWSTVGPVLDRGGSGASRLISNRVYLGEIKMGEWHNPAAHEPIVEVSLFEAAQLGGTRPARSGRPPALLAGLLRCAGCRRLLTFGDGRYVCNPQNAAGRCLAPASIAPSLIEPFVERNVLAHIADLRFSAAEADQLVDAAAVKLTEAEAELLAFTQATEAAGVGAEHFAAGLSMRVDAVEAARRALAQARLAAAPAFEGDLASLWPDLGVGERRQVLRGSLAVVWVWKGRGRVSDRVVMAVTAPPDLPRSGPRRYPIVPIAREDVEGAIEPLPEDVGEGDGSA